MKKVMAGALAMFLALTLAGCSDNEEEHESDDEQDTASESEARPGDRPVQTLTQVESNMRAPTADGWQHWICANETTIEWRRIEDQGAMDLMFGIDKTIHRLRMDIAGVGPYYTDGLLSFRIDGDTGILYWNENGEIIGDQCVERDGADSPDDNSGHEGNTDALP